MAMTKDVARGRSDPPQGRNPERGYDFQTIKRHFDQFDGKKIMWNSQELQRRFDIMVGLEDKSYFDRENSYNWFSVEFLKYKIETYRENRAWKKHFKAKRSWRYNLKCIWRLIKRFRLIRYVINRFVDWPSYGGENCWDFANT